MGGQNARSFKHSAAGTVGGSIPGGVLWWLRVWSVWVARMQGIPSIHDREICIQEKCRKICGAGDMQAGRLADRKKCRQEDIQAGSIADGNICKQKISMQEDKAEGGGSIRLPVKTIPHQQDSGGKHKRKMMYFLFRVPDSAVSRLGNIFVSRCLMFFLGVLISKWVFYFLPDFQSMRSAARPLIDRPTARWHIVWTFGRKSKNFGKQKN